jgi:hypothetical protein
LIVTVTWATRYSSMTALSRAIVPSSRVATLSAASASAA